MRDPEIRSDNLYMPPEQSYQVIDLRSQILQLKEEAIKFKTKQYRKLMEIDLMLSEVAGCNLIY